MGLLYNLKRFISIKASKAIKVNQKNIEVLEYELEKSKLQIDSLGDKLSKLRADRQVAVNDMEKSEAKMIKFEEILNTAVEKDDAEMGNEALALIEKGKMKLQIVGKNVEYFDGVIERLEQQYESLRQKYEQKALTFEKLQMQSEFADSMKTINEELKKNYSGDDFDFSGIEAIEKEIEKSVYYEQDRNEQIGSAASLEDKIEAASTVNKFEEYKKLLQAKQGE